MECKYYSCYFLSSAIFRNNRNILECKLLQGIYLHWWRVEIIETYWNVNSSRQCFLLYLNHEIIETYWNVNKQKQKLKQIQKQEIIETYWNVNVYSILLLRSYRREIIETYWNVNDYFLYENNESISRNNRNILECKFTNSGLNTLSVNGNNRNILECKWWLTLELKTCSRK